MVKIAARVRQAVSLEGESEYLHIGPSIRFHNTYLFLVVLGFSLWLFLTNVSVFLDDVFIYLRVVKNITAGNGPVLNPGDRHFPVTSPLWVFLLALLHKIFGFIDLMTLAKMAFTVMLAAASYLGFVCIRSYIGSWAILIPLPIFFNFITLTTVGGEIALVYLSLFGMLWGYYIKKNFIITGAWTAVAYLARGEAALLLIPIVLHYMFFGKPGQETFRSIAANLGKMAVVLVAIVSIWHIYYALEFHTLFPNTLETKIVQGKSGLWPLYYQKGRVHAMEILGKKVYPVCFLLFGLLYFRALSLSLLCYTILHYYTYKFLSIAYYHWYFYDFYLFIPVFTVFGIIAFFVTLGKLLRGYNCGIRGTTRYPVFFSAAVVLILFIVALAWMVNTTKIRNVSLYNDAKDDRYQRYSSAARWIKQRLNKGDVLLTTEIGIIGYFLDDCRIRDMNGIATPAVTVENINHFEYFVAKYVPRFIFFPPWQPHKNNMEYIVFNHEVYIYKKVFDEAKNGESGESVFIYVDHESTPPNIDILEQLKANAAYPGPEFNRIEKDIILSIPLSKEFQTELKVPRGTSSVFLHLGLMPGTINKTDGGFRVVCRMEGIKEKKKVLLWREVLTPFAGHREEKATILFPSEFSNFDSLQITIKVKPPPGIQGNNTNREDIRVALYDFAFRENHALYSRRR